MSDLTRLAQSLLSKGPHKLETSPRRIRVRHAGIWVADAQNAKWVWEHQYFPQYYLPISTFSKAVTLKQGAEVEGGGARLYTLEVAGTKNDRLIAFNKGPLEGLIRVEFASVDAWYEEDQAIYVHPKDPYKRVDILPSSRHIVVKIEDELIAESHSSLALFETGLPTRYYLPPTSVDWSKLSESKTTTRCPYKGEANYYNVHCAKKEHRDAIWWYRFPTPESVVVAGQLCFYNEKVDIWLDGVKLERSRTKFS
ncbi:MAG: hypothetical protein M1824_006617 [Vezdaea acicularis]|nr:MAG: hypothetical protein M1824_006617 [Vezdaea acicularis]